MADHIEPLPSGGDSPWARDVPISPPPHFPSSWSTGDRSTGDRSNDGHPSQSGASEIGELAAHGAGDPMVVELGDQHPTAPNSPGPTNRKRSVLIAGVVAVVAVAAIGTQVIGGRGDDVTDETAVESTVAVSDSEPAPPTTQRQRRPTTTVGATLPEPEPQWVTAPIELSPRLKAMVEPTEVIALSGDGTVYSISIPTGVVRSIDTESRASENALVLGQESIVLLSYNGQKSKLVRVGLPVSPIEVSPSIGQVIQRPGTDSFIVIPNQTNSDRPIPFNLAADGALTPITDGPFTEVDGWGIRFLPSGEMVVTDTGGLYVVDEVGGATRRISTGDLVAIGLHHFVIRECDELRVCDYVRTEARTGAGSIVQLTPSSGYGGYFDSPALSPDGSAMTSLNYADSGPKRQLVDLDTGASMELGLDNSNYGYNPGESIWAADSSGIFVIDKTELMFLDRATGETVAVAPGVDLGNIVAVAARPLSGTATP